ncbi:hypothetical protein [Streptomyces sp. NPDC092952]|uniref:hypothetical protein n=1 Tax=Streptomyces sp. NPDC092952 TaxID=3366018 RepID=UPI0038062C6D
MNDMIKIQPARARRRAFAAWAVAQVPKIRTVGTNTFAVPAALFTEAPEDILIGSLVDGHRYVSPAEDAASSELVGVATPDGFREAVPGGPLPEAPGNAYGPDSTPVPDAMEGGDSGGPSAETPEGVFLCTTCSREFTSERGRDTHSRLKHPEA